MKRTSVMTGSIKTEFTILRVISHPNIVSIYEFFIDDQNCSMIQELMEGESLFDRVLHEKHLNELESKIIIRQILMALFYLHSNNIIHRDIKMENLVFKEKKSNSVKLIDFGSAKQVNYYRQLNSEMIGTVLYMPPEVLASRYNHKCDVWSLGVVLFVMLSGSFPFNGRSVEEIRKKIMTDRLVFPDDEWKGVSYEAKDLIKKMLNKNADSRLGADECLTHAWFKELKTNSKTNQEMMVNKIYGFSCQNVLKRSLLTYMMTHLDLHDEISKFVSLFYDMDENSNGIIEEDEFSRMVASVFGKEVADTESVKL